MIPHTIIKGQPFAGLAGKKFTGQDHPAHFRSSAVFWIVCI